MSSSVFVAYLACVKEKALAGLANCLPRRSPSHSCARCIGIHVFRRILASRQRYRNWLRLCICCGIVLRDWCHDGPAPPKVPLAVHTRSERTYFCYFCLLGGWAFVYVLSPLHRIPSVGAVVDEAGALWMLGVMLGLRDAISSKVPVKVFLWSGALLVYPVVMLLLGGFLSYGSAAAIIVASGLLVSARSYPRALLGVSLAAFLGLSLFVVRSSVADCFIAARVLHPDLFSTRQ